jgi:hypothetical protein
MPSLGESFSNAVYECLERGIPFIASDAGAPVELVAPEDRPRVLFQATPEGVAEALTRVLEGGEALQPARAAFDPNAAADQWEQILEVAAQPRPHEPAADTAVVRDEADVLDDDCFEMLSRAQAAAAADVVTCGVRGDDGTERLFLGQPYALGLVANHYGTVGLMRGSLDQDDDDPWLLYAKLALDGAKIVSVPRALAAPRTPPGDVTSDPATALRVAEQFERRLPRSLRSLARLAAGLAAAPTPAPRRRRLSRRR